MNVMCPNIIILLAVGCNAQMVCNSVSHLVAHAVSAVVNTGQFAHIGNAVEGGNFAFLTLVCTVKQCSNSVNIIFCSLQCNIGNYSTCQCFFSFSATYSTNSKGKTITFNNILQHIAAYNFVCQFAI